jgi:hypothetical protein
MSEKQLQLWMNVLAVVLLAALVVDFAVVIRAALTAH